MVDTGPLFRMGKDLAECYRKDMPDLVLMVKASGIALMLTMTRALDDVSVVLIKRMLLWCRVPILPWPGEFFICNWENVIRVYKNLPQAAS